MDKPKGTKPNLVLTPKKMEGIAKKLEKYTFPSTAGVNQKIQSATFSSTLSMTDNIKKMAESGDDEWRRRVHANLKDVHDRLMAYYHKEREAAFIELGVGMLTKIMPEKTARHVMSDPDRIWVSQRLMGWTFVHEKRNDMLLERLVLMHNGTRVAQEDLEGFAAAEPGTL